MSDDKTRFFTPVWHSAAIKRTEKTMNAHVVRRAEPPPVPRFGRGTRRELGRSAEEASAHQTEELPLGTLWHRTLRLETLGRNLETAGGLEQTWRLGCADVPIDVFAALVARKRIP